MILISIYNVLIPYYCDQKHIKLEINNDNTIQVTIQVNYSIYKKLKAKE